MTGEFSLYDFCKRNADKVQLFGEETLDDEGKIIPFSEQAALMTHYLQLRDLSDTLPYTTQAEKILDLWHGFIRQEPQAHLLCQLK